MHVGSLRVAECVHEDAKAGEVGRKVRRIIVIEAGKTRKERGGMRGAERVVGRKGREREREKGERRNEQKSTKGHTHLKEERWFVYQKWIPSP